MTALELFEGIYADHANHIELVWEMGECDCRICITLDGVRKYLKKMGELA